MRFVVGLLLVDAPHSALNMRGTAERTPERNVTEVKKLRRGKDQYAYVSPQAWRYWWRETLKEHFGWKLSPLTRQEKQVFTEANPIEYEDDDIFGYMKAIATKKDKKEGGKTLTRISPLKTTPLISIFPERNSVTLDVGYASRHEGDPVPYNQEFYSTILKGAFSLDLDAIGRFTILDKAGFRNIYSEDETLRSLARLRGVEISDKEWILPSNERKRRATDTIKALKFMFGGAKLTQYLTDVSPKFIIMAMVECGINPFISNIVYEKKGELIFDADGLKSRILDLRDVFNPRKIYLGVDEGFLSEWDIDVNVLCEDEDLKKENIEIRCLKVREAIDEIVKDIEDYYK